ncbi:MAG: OmpA family protein [Phaeodactylibacter sp.]|nr:OmpA family protein [Phaeodactylibacter sp.]MCB9272923.1 OmpA family protein [Lewinellaceae bacterium]
MKNYFNINTMRSLFYCSLLCFMSLNLLAQGLPENPEEGKCYVRCVTPDVWENEEVKVLVKPAHKKLEVIPAAYKDEQVEVLVKPGTKKFVYVPAQYKTVVEDFLIEEPASELEVKEAQFAVSTAEVEVKPAYARYEYQVSTENCSSPDLRDCMVLCYVKHPAEKKSVIVDTLMRDATVETQQSKGNTVSITKQVLSSEARVDTIEIPPVYETYTRRVLVQDATVKEVEVPAVYTAETVRRLKEKGGLTVWEEIQCDLVDYNVLPIYYDFNSARLTGDSKSVIDEKIFKLMKAKPLISIEISSYTDCRADEAYNLDLSQRRAEAVVDYLVSKGIERRRLVARGYGESKPVNKCIDGVPCTEEEHAKNRRTEFRVISN